MERNNDFKLATTIMYFLEHLKASCVAKKSFASRADDIPIVDVHDWGDTRKLAISMGETTIVVNADRRIQ